MPDLPIINTTITVANVKDIPYTRKDGTTATGKAIGHKNADGSWLNLTDFDEARFGLYFPGSVLAVSYSEKFATEPNGAPKMDKYNNRQKVYRTIMAAGTTGAPQTAQNSLPTAQQGRGSPTPHFEQDRNESIRAQTTLKAAAEMYAACLGANKALKWEFEEFERIFTGTKAILDGKNELDVALDIGKKAGMVAEADPELPGPDAPADEFEGVF
jgi:hypothetical protein